MHTHDEPHNPIEECFEALKQSGPRYGKGEAICGVLGLLVLVLMLLIATGTVPLYDWEA
jgi:hypothetical protein